MESTIVHKYASSKSCRVVLATADEDEFNLVAKGIARTPDLIINPTYTIWLYPAHEVEKNIIRESRLHTATVLLVKGEYFDAWEIIDIAGIKYTKYIMSYVFDGHSTDKFVKKFFSELSTSKTEVFGKIGT